MTTPNTTFILAASTRTMSIPGRKGAHKRVFGLDTCVFAGELASTARTHAARAGIETIAVFECTGFGPGGHAVQGAQVGCLVRMADGEFVVAWGVEVEGFRTITSTVAA